MKIDNNRIVSVICDAAKEFEDFAISFAKSRFLIASIDNGFAENDDENIALQKIAEGIRCSVYQNGTSIALDIDYTKDDGNYLELETNGQPAPYAGGSGGNVKFPDGHVEKSNVDPRFWGTRLDYLARPGSDVLQEVRMMLKDLFTQRIHEVIQEQRSEIIAAVKSEIVNEIKSAIHH